MLALKIHPENQQIFGDINNNNNNNNNNNKVLVARGGLETANPARTGETLGDESLEDPQQEC